MMTSDQQSAFYLVYKSCPSFWSNYNKSCSWLKSQGFKPVNCPFVCPTESIADQQIVVENISDSIIKPPNNQGDDSIKEDDSHIDDDYIRFIIETRKHQKEQEQLKAERIKMEENEEIIYKDICEIDQQRLIGSSEQNSVQTDYLNLYGSEAETIKSKETLLQSDFNVYCDTHNPQFWPTIPIKI